MRELSEGIVLTRESLERMLADGYGCRKMSDHYPAVLCFKTIERK